MLKNICGMVLSFLVFNSANAAIVSYEGKVTNARVQNYRDNNIVVWWLPTGDSCGGNGSIRALQLTTEERQRIWATLMTAKVTGKSVYIEYDNTNCNLSSVAL